MLAEEVEKHGVSVWRRRRFLDCATQTKGSDAVSVNNPPAFKNSKSGLRCAMEEPMFKSLSLLALLPFGRSCLLLCALLPIFVLFSDLSNIFTSADQHSAQTTHFWEKEDSLPPTASSLHSGDRKIQLSTFKQMRENASSGIYLLHELPQTSTKDCGS